jgi:hypothetical protein
MNPRPPSPFRAYLVVSIILVLVGGGIVTYAILMLRPVVWARWLLFFGGSLGLTGLALPVTWFLNLRFRSEPAVGSSVIVRQAIWFGVYGAVLTWLQQERLVTIWSSLGLAGGLIAIEYLIRMREKSRWLPGMQVPGQSLEPNPTRNDENRE